MCRVESVVNSRTKMRIKYCDTQGNRRPKTRMIQQMSGIGRKRNKPDGKKKSGMKKLMPPLTFAFLLCFIAVFVWYSIIGVNESESVESGQESSPATEDTPVIRTPTTPLITPPVETSEDPLLYVPPPVKVKGLYVMAWNAGVPEYMSNYIELCEATELNALVIDVKDDEGNITFNAANENLSAACMNIVPGIKGLVADLKSREIYTIARIVCFRDELWSELHPELAIQNRDGGLWKDGGGRTWLDPYNKGTWEYVADIAREAALLGFDEIQLDYVRFPTDGRIGDISYGAAGEQKTKTEIISEFLADLREMLTEYDVMLSADVFGIIALSRSDSEAIGQDITLLLDNADSICPMIYPSHFANKRQNGVGQYINGTLFEAPDLEPYEVVYNTLLEFKRYLSDDESDDIRNNDNRTNQAIIRPYLQNFTAEYLGEGYYQRYTADTVREQINAVYDAGFDEWILWNHNSVYSVDAFSPVEADIADEVESDPGSDSDIENP